MSQATSYDTARKKCCNIPANAVNFVIADSTRRRFYSVACPKFAEYAGKKDHFARKKRSVIQDSKGFKYCLMY